MSMTGRRQALALAWSVAKRRSFLLGLSIAAALTAGACTALIADRVGVLATPAAVSMTSLAWFGALLLGRAVLVAVRSLSSTAFARWFSHDLRISVYERLLHAGDLRAMGRGDAVGRVLQDTNQLHYFASSTLGDLATQAASTLALISVMARHDRQMTLLLTISAPLFAWVLFRGLSRTRDAYRTLGQRQASLSNEATELLGFLRLSKVYGAEQALLARFEERSLSLAAQHGKVALSTNALAPVLLVVGMGALLFLLLGWSQTDGPLLTSDRLSFLTACALLYRPLVAAAQSMSTLSIALAAVDRIAELLTVQPAPRAQAPHSARGDGSFQLELGGFSYAHEPVLKALVLTVQRGEMIAIVGENGAGKSTLLDLLLGLLQPASGELSVGDGLRIPFAAEQRRPEFAWMPQEPLLITGSVLENVTLGSAAPDAERAQQALRLAGAWDLIAGLEGGLTTLLGEGGRKLSRGEAQRICLARAVYRAAPCLLLDEPTAFLDGIAAGELVNTVRSLRRHTTLVVVTHALGLAAVADRVIVLDAGRIVEEGRPTDLWRAQGPFFQLFRAQHDPLSGL